MSPFFVTDKTFVIAFIHYLVYNRCNKINKGEIKMAGYIKIKDRLNELTDDEKVKH